MVANSVCHPTSAALIISRQRGRSIYPDRGRADCERTKTIIEIEKTGQSCRQRLYLIAGGRAGLVAATGGDSAGVKSDRRWTAMGGSRGRGTLDGGGWGVDGVTTVCGRDYIALTCYVQQWIKSIFTIPVQCPHK